MQIGVVLAAVIDLVIDHHVLAVHIRVHAVPIDRKSADGELVDRIWSVIALVHEDIIGKEKIVRRQLRPVGAEQPLLKTDRHGSQSVRAGRAGYLRRSAVALHGAERKLRQLGDLPIAVRRGKERAEHPVHLLIRELERFGRRLRLIGKHEIGAGNGRFTRRDHAHNAVHRQSAAGERKQDRYQQCRRGGTNGFFHMDAPFIFDTLS